MLWLADPYRGPRLAARGSASRQKKSKFPILKSLTLLFTFSFIFLVFFYLNGEINMYIFEKAAIFLLSAIFQATTLSKLFPHMYICYQAV